MRGTLFPQVSQDCHTLPPMDTPPPPLAARATPGSAPKKIPMSHRPFPRDNDGFRPWKRDSERPQGRDEGSERPRGPAGETDRQGNYRTDNVWRSETAHRAAESSPRPWQRRDAAPGNDRGGFGGERRPFERRPWERRDGAPGGDRGGFGGDRGGFGGERRPFERRPWQRRDDDRGPREEGATEERAEKRRFPAQPEGELIYGRQPVREVLLAQRRGIRELILADGVKASEEITEIEALCLERSVTVKRYDRETLDAWLNAANHQGVLAVCDEYPYVEFSEIHEALVAAEGNAMVVLLDHVVDPQNLGSLLRSCEAAGVLGVVIPADRAVGVTPAAVRASAGAAEHLRVAIVPSLVGALEKFKDKEGQVWVTGLEAVEEAKPYTEIDFKGKVALVIGSEGLGLSRLVREHCDFLAKLPMFGKVGSLNAGVAGALAMYEVLRQHGRR